MLALSFFSAEAISEGQSRKLNIDSMRPFSMSVEMGGIKNKIIIPDKIMDEIEGEDVNVRLADITGDGMDEILITPELEGVVNICSRVYRYNAINSTLDEVIFAQGAICNFKIIANHIVSSHRDAAAWVEDIYMVQQGVPRLVLTDRCIGCGEVVRKMHFKDGSEDEFLVTDEVSYIDRKAVTAVVKAKRAKIYRSPCEAELTKMYLIEGDTIDILGYDSSSSGQWVNFRFHGKKIVTGWLMQKDISRRGGLQE